MNAKPRPNSPKGAVAAEVARTARELRAGTREQRAEAHERLGELEHGVEESMLSGAHTRQHPDEVRDRAHAISRRADEHLDAAADLRSPDAAQPGTNTGT